MAEQRTDNLEMKIAFLEDALEKLSDEFFQQQKELTLLKAQQQKLIAQVRSLNESNHAEQGLSMLDEKPPHY